MMEYSVIGDYNRIRISWFRIVPGNEPKRRHLESMYVWSGHVKTRGYVLELAEMLNLIYSCLNASIGWSREALNAG